MYILCDIPPLCDKNIGEVVDILLCGGGTCMMKMTARRRNGSGLRVDELWGVADIIQGSVRLEQTSHSPWVGGSQCMVKAVARRPNGGGPWVGELLGVADVIQG
jgi:hypothetical protein